MNSVSSIQPMKDPYDEAKKLNTIASAVMEACGWLPLSVRYRAANHALAVVEAWRQEPLSSDGEPLSDWERGWGPAKTKRPHSSDGEDAQ